MTGGQKIIKGLAIAFGVFIVINIVSAAFLALTTVFNVFSVFDSNVKPLETNKDLEIEEKEITFLDIDLSITKLIIKRGETLKAETNNDNIKVYQSENRLEIEEKRHYFFQNNNDLELIIYIPDSFNFENIEIEAGAGSIMVESLKADKVSLDLGAGVVQFDYLEAVNEATISGGVGSVTILNSKLNNLNLDMGVGQLTLTTNLTGKSEIDAGVGEMNLVLLNKKEDYKISVDKGIGSILVDSVNVSDDSVIGSGPNTIDIDGGIGKITIDFEDEFANNNESTDIPVNIEKSLIEVKEYFQDKENNIIILGELESGSFHYGDTVYLMNDEVILKTTTISSKQIDYGTVSLEEAKINDKVFFQLDNVTLEELDQIETIVLK